MVAGLRNLRSDTQVTFDGENHSVLASVWVVLQSWCETSGCNQNVGDWLTTGRGK